MTLLQKGHFHHEGIEDTEDLGRGSSVSSWWFYPFCSGLIDANIPRINKDHYNEERCNI